MTAPPSQIIYQFYDMKLDYFAIFLN